MRPADVSGGFRSGPLWYWLVERIWRVEHAFERAKARRTDQDTPVRIFFVGALFAAGFLTLAVGASTKVLLADHSRVRDIYAIEPRADLTDRNGRLLAVDMIHYDLYLNRKEIFDTSETRRRLGAALPEAAARIPAALAAGRRTILASGLTPDEAQRIKDMGLPGVSFEPDERRLYPMGAVAAHLIGSTEKQGGRGLSGAERSLDKLIVEEGALGKQVPLSIDVRVQAVVEEELHKAVTDMKALGGVGIVVDVHTGEILALASDPDFDPNQMGASSYNAQYNRAVAGRYELGSVMKMFTIAMGLDSHTVTLDTLFDCAHPFMVGTRAIHDLHSAGRALTVAEVFTHSSNIGAARIGALAGSDTFLRYFKAFGLFHAAEVGLVESASPQLPPRLNDSNLASMAFGHAIAVSPLALSAGAISIFNGGVAIPLSIRRLDPGKAPQGKRVISERTSRLMLDLMRRNVIEGTGKRADAPGLSVGGKTGTGEKPENGGIARHKVMSSFAAVFPTQGPLDAKRYFVLISIDEPDPALGPVTAVTTAAPVAGKVIDRIAPFLGVQRRAPEPLQQPIAGPPVEELGRRRGRMKRLSDILRREVPGGDPLIAGVTADSRKLAPGFLFAALPGSRTDGRSFIPMALEKGAAAILAPDDVTGLPVPVVHARDLRRAYALAARGFWGAQPEVCVAVTGTNGKTSVASFCRQLFERLGRRSASMGTLGVQAAGEQLTPPGLTTPDAADVAEMLASLAGRGVTHLALEASSHGIDQRRLDGVELTAAGWTNLTQDHLDYHGVMGAYRAAKLRLFDTLLPRGRTAVLNADSEEFPAFAAAAVINGQSVWSVGEGGQALKLLQRTPRPDGQLLKVRHGDRAFEVRLPLAGAFQADNALVAAGLCIAAGEDPATVFAGLGELEGAAGRLQRVGEGGRGGEAYVDYAHTPDGLQTVLEALRPHARGRLIVVFGAGGDRDRGKRPMMGAIAARLADVAIVTDDNPRSEDPAAIRAEVLAGGKGLREVGDRRQAIAEACALLRDGDVVVVAGKGHEQGQTVAGVVHPFDDVAETARALEAVHA